MDDFGKVLLAALLVSIWSCAFGEDRNKKAYVAWFAVAGLLFILMIAVERM